MPGSHKHIIHTHTQARICAIWQNAQGKSQYNLVSAANTTAPRALSTHTHTRAQPAGIWHMTFDAPTTCIDPSNYETAARGEEKSHKLAALKANITMTFIPPFFHSMPHALELKDKKQKKKKQESKQQTAQ